MSVLPCEDELDATELQTWNAPTFIDDLRQSGVTTWSSSRTDSVNLSQSLRSDECSKENRSPNGENRNSLVKILNVSPSPVYNCEESSGKDVDVEIEEIEKEISRLSVKLVALRLEKVEKNIRDLDMNSVKIGKTVRSAVRGVSLGPMEIASNVKFHPLTKTQTTTPIISVQNRRKSCFWKLQEIDELKVTKDRRKSLSNSPKSRKAAARNQPQRQAVTTVGSKKGVKKEGVILSIQPKKLFGEEGERSILTKKPVKSGRIIASRYHQINTSAARKSNEEGMDKSFLDKTPLKMGRATEVLPKMKARRCLEESSKDLGCAKRVSELVGKRGYFDE